MSKYQKKIAHGYWNDEKKEEFVHVIALDSWDEVEDWEDAEIFHFFDGDEPIGDHGDFTITKIEDY